MARKKKAVRRKIVKKFSRRRGTRGRSETKKTSRSKKRATTLKKKIAQKAHGTSPKRPARKAVRKPVDPHRAERTDGQLRKSDRRRIERAHERLLKTLSDLDQRSRDLLSVIDSIEQTAIAKREDSIVKELATEELLDHLLELAQLFQQTPPDALPETFRPFVNVPAAWILWLDKRFNLVAQHQPGSAIEVPMAELDPNQRANSETTPTGKLVKVKVRTAGWKRGRSFVVHPRFELLEDSADA